MVVDFVDIYYGRYHWPAFNVADSAICVGALLLALQRRQRQVSGKGPCCARYNARQIPTRTAGYEASLAGELP